MKFTLMLLLALPFAAMAQEDPETVYSKMHKALLASNVDEALKYSTEARRKELSALPQAQKVATVQLIAKMLPQSYSIAGSNIAPDGKTAELRASGMVPGMMGGKPETNYGVILFVKEQNEWRVDKSEWSNQRPASFGLAQAKPAAAAPPKGEMSPAEAQRMLSAKDEEVQMSEEQLKKAREEEEALARKKAAEDAAAERERQKQARMALCVIKPVMTDEEIDFCRVAYKD